MTATGVRLRQRYLRVLAGRENGTTLMELMVGMTLMAIFMGMFTGVVIAMYGAQSKAESVNNTSAQLNQAFLSLDKTVRYAAAISVPGRSSVSGDWYVEFRTANTGSQACTQLRLNIATQQLQRRTWTPSGSEPISGWLPISSGISNGAAKAGDPTQPFVLAADSAVRFQQLRITLVAPADKGSTKTSSTSSFSFTAVNSTMPAPTSICTEAGRP